MQFVNIFSNKIDIANVLEGWRFAYSKIEVKELGKYLQEERHKQCLKYMHIDAIATARLAIVLLIDLLYNVVF